MSLPRPVAVFLYHALGRVQAVAATLANLGRPVPRDYRAYDVSKLLRAHRLAQRLQDGEEVLDVGCGDARLLRDLGLFRSLKRRVGIDVDLPRSPEPAVEVAAYDGQALPFADRSFDSVVFGYFLHYLTRNHAVRLLKEGCRVARRNVFVLDDSQPAWSFWYRTRNRLERLRSDILYGAVSDDLYRGSGNEEMYLTYDGWRRLLEELPRVATVEVEPLGRVSGLVHHTLFHARLEAVTSRVE
ncbi:MAG TPA: class I SAM-dependent methyltransferase [Chthoniobacterales bacterium]|jgi:SAM-dependent methyltransferase|nr:class I SAM-dependent methyltransferase [Chthoniobacterales bacterium]